MERSLRSLPMARFVILLCVILWPSKDALGRDDLFLVHFSTGPNWDSTKSPNEQGNFAEHSANLGRLRSEGFILFGARYEEYGMIVVRSPSLKSATEIIEADPGVRSGLFTFAISPLGVFYQWKE